MDGSFNQIAPTASPEASEIDPISSPRKPTYLAAPGVNAKPSSESVNALALAAADVLTPSLFQSYISSCNHLLPHVLNPNSRAASFSVAGSVKHLHILPSVGAADNTKNVTIATSHTLANDDYVACRCQFENEKGR